MITITQLRDICYKHAVDKGFYEKLPNHKLRTYLELCIDQRLLLIASELNEAYEEIRKGNTPQYEYTSGEDNKPEGFPAEIADAIIRIMDMCGYLEIDIERVILEKLEYNKNRPHKHGKEF